MTNLLNVKVYKPCKDKCGVCHQCVEFDRLAGSIDVAKKSEYDRRRAIDVEIRKDQR